MILENTLENIATTNQDGVFIDANGNNISYLGNDSPISKATQLTLHAGLGCALGSAARREGNCSC